MPVESRNTFSILSSSGARLQFVHFHFVHHSDSTQERAAGHGHQHVVRADDFAKISLFPVII